MSPIFYPNPAPPPPPAEPAATPAAEPSPPAKPRPRHPPSGCAPQDGRGAWPAARRLPCQCGCFASPVEVVPSCSAHVPFSFRQFRSASILSNTAGISVRHVLHRPRIVNSTVSVVRRNSSVSSVASTRRARPRSRSKNFLPANSV